MRTAAILPVKRFSAAKQRLGESIADGLRAELARAMVGDVLSALRDCAAIDAVIVVTCEPAVAAAAGYVGAIVVQDTAESGQSAAAAIGLQLALDQGFDRALCVPGDCPAIDPTELEAMLGALPLLDGRSNGTQSEPTSEQISEPTSEQTSEPTSEQTSEPTSLRTGRAGQVVIVPDRHDTGTNGLLLAPPEVIEPSFGPNSRARHEQLARSVGVPCRVERLPSLLLDVDTGDDLAALRERLADERARAPRTRAVLGLAGRHWQNSRPAA